MVTFFLHKMRHVSPYIMTQKGRTLVIIRVQLIPTRVLSNTN